MLNENQMVLWGKKKVSNLSIQHTSDVLVPCLPPTSPFVLDPWLFQFVCSVMMPQSNGTLTERLQFPTCFPSRVPPHLWQQCFSYQCHIVLWRAGKMRCLLLSLREIGLQILTVKQQQHVSDLSLLRDRTRPLRSPLMRFWGSLTASKLYLLGRRCLGHLSLSLSMSLTSLVAPLSVFCS